ncbi:MAG TPA: flagellar motor switch protein FliM [Acidimicrobiales bacterium]|nr:flagellar motor switch protein FliM [Acidimicrobiales bacterium]
MTPVADAATDTDSTSGAQVRLYDFRTPEVLDRNRLRSLALVLENFSRLASRRLSVDLHVPVELVVTDTREMVWEELAGAHDAYCMVLFGLPPLPGRALLHLPIELAMAIVDLRMGGAGAGSYPTRPLSDIDVELLTDVMGGALDQLAAAFGHLAAVSLGGMQVESTAQLLQVVRANESCLAVRLEVRLGEDATMTRTCSLGLPLSTLRPLMRALLHMGEGTRGFSDGVHSAAEERLLDPLVDVAVRFQPKSLSSQDILGLQVGDVINLHHPRDLPLEVAVEDVVYLAALPMERARRIACTVVDPEEQTHDH